MYCADIHMVKKWTKSTSAFDRTGPDVYWRSLFFSHSIWDVWDIPGIWTVRAQEKNSQTLKGEIQKRCLEQLLQTPRPSDRLPPASVWYLSAWGDHRAARLVNKSMLRLARSQDFLDIQVQSVQICRCHSEPKKLPSEAFSAEAQIGPWRKEWKRLYLNKLLNKCARVNIWNGIFKSVCLIFEWRRHSCKDHLARGRRWQNLHYTLICIFIHISDCMKNIET